MATSGRARSRSRDEDTPRGRSGGKDNRPSAGMRGQGGYAIAKEEAEKAKARRELNKWGPSRFWMSPEEKNVEVIITDNSIDDLFWMHEHQMWNGKGNDYVVCAKDHPNSEPCVICEEAQRQSRNRESIFKHSYYALYLSIIDTREFTNKETKKKSYFRKSLLVIKNTQVDRFMKILLKAADQNGGSIRGVSLLLSRGDDKSARHGEPDMNDNGTLFDIVSEKELKRDFSTKAVTKDGKTIRPANWELTPYDYEAEFKVPDQGQLAAAYEIEPTEGSKAAMEKEWDDDKPARGRRRRGGDDDDAGDADEAPRRGRRGRAEPEAEPEEDRPTRGRANRRAVEDADDDENDVDNDPEDNGDDPDEADDEPPARGRRRRGDDDEPAEAPARSRRGRAEPEEDPDEDDAPRGRSRSRGRDADADEDDAPRGRSRGRGRADADEDDAPRGRSRGRARGGEVSEDDIPFER